MSRPQLRDRVAVVTGTGSGLGASFAFALGCAGARVVCLDIDPHANATTCDRLEREGISVEGRTVDVGDAGSVAAGWAEILQQHGGVDVLVHAAGISGTPRRLDEIEPTEWREVMSVNLDSAFWLLRGALPAMMARARGSVILISSICALRGIRSPRPIIAASYSASKAALLGLSKQVAVEYAPYGIRVNVIAPGWHSGTKLGARRVARSTTEELRDDTNWITARIPLGRFGRPDEMDALVQYLASDASAYVTGQVFVHDGGWLAE